MFLSIPLLRRLVLIFSLVASFGLTDFGFAQNSSPDSVKTESVKLPVPLQTTSIDSVTMEKMSADEAKRDSIGQSIPAAALQPPSVSQPAATSLTQAVSNPQAGVDSTKLTPTRPTAYFAPERLLLFVQGVSERKEDKLREYLIGELNQYINMFPDNGRGAEAQYLIGGIYADMNDKHEAFAAYTKSVYLYPNSPWREKAAEEALKLAKDIGDYEPKRAQIMDAISLRTGQKAHSESCYEWLNLLMGLNDKKLYEYLHTEIQEFIRQHPTYPQIDEALVWQGDMYQKREKYREAEVTYLKTQFMYPESSRLPYAHYQRGLLLYKELGKHQLAADAFSRVVRDYPKNEYAADALYMLAEVKTEKLDEHRSAVADYRRVVDEYSASPRVVEALFQIGLVNEKRLKDYLAAISAYDEIVIKHGQNEMGIEALQRMSDIYKDDLHSYTNAADALVRVATVFRDFKDAPELIIKAGDVIADKIKDYVLAITYYEKVAQYYPGHKKVKDATNRIEKMRKKMAKN